MSAIEKLDDDVQTIVVDMLMEGVYGLLREQAQVAASKLVSHFRLNTPSEQRTLHNLKMFVRGFCRGMVYDGASKQ